MLSYSPHLGPVDEHLAQRLLNSVTIPTKIQTLIALPMLLLLGGAAYELLSLNDKV